MKAQIFVLCVLVLAGCAVSVKEDTYLPDNETLEQWCRSAEANKGYIILGSQVSPPMAAETIKKIVTLDEDPNVLRITVIINSNGGEASALRTIYNAIRLTEKPVDTVNIGNCYSAACAIFAGATGKRYACKNAHFMVHGPQVAHGSARKYKDVLDFEKSCFESIVTAGSHLPDSWFPLTSKNQFFTAQEALEYGFVDELIDRLPTP